MIGQAVRHSLVYGGATVLSRAALLVALLVLPFLLTTREYGALAMIVTIAALVATVVPLEISQAIARFYPPAPASEKKAWASTAWAFLLATAAAFLLLSQLFAAPLCRLILGDLSFLPAFRLALFLMAFQCVFQFVQNQYRWEFRTVEFVLVSIAFSLLTLGLSLGLGVLIDPPLFGVVLGQALGAGIAAALGGFGLRRGLALRLDRRRLADLLRFSLPLVPASIALFVSVHAGRLILNGMLSLTEVGLFTLATQIAGIATLGIVGVQAAVTPLVMANYARPETPAQLARLFEAMAGLALVSCLTLGLFAPELIYYVGNPEYAGAGGLVLLIAPGLMMAQMYVFAPGFAVAKRTDLQMWVSIASAFVAVAANFAMIAIWGLIGAAAATLLSGATFLGLWFALGQRLYRVPVRWGRVAAAAAGAALLGAFGYTYAYDGIAQALLIKAALVAAAGALAVLVGLVPLRGGIRLLAGMAGRMRARPSGAGR